MGISSGVIKNVSGVLTVSKTQIKVSTELFKLFMDMI